MVLRLLLHPFCKPSGLSVFFLASLVCGGLFSFLFINTTYRQLFSEQLRGIYPEVMIQGPVVPDGSKLPPYAQARTEVFVKNMDISFWDEQKLEIGVKSGVRGIDGFNSKMLLNFDIDYSQADKNTIYLSQALADVLYVPGQPQGKLFLGDKFGGLLEVQVGGVFNLMNAERWVLIPAELLKELEIGLFARTVEVFYPAQGTGPEDFYTQLVRDLPDYSLVNWNDRLPLFYRCFWDVVEAGCGLVGACVVLLFIVYFWNIFQSTYLELTNTIFLLRLFSTNTCFVAGFLAVLWTAYLILACLAANLLSLVFMGLIGSEKYQLTVGDYLHYLYQLVDTDGWLALGGLFCFLALVLTVMIRTVCVRPVGQAWN